MTFCPACGTQNKDEARFCARCGHALPEARTTQPVKVASEPVPPVDHGASRPDAPAQDASARTAVPTQPPASPGVAEPVAQTSKARPSVPRGLLVGVVVLSLVVLGLAIWLLAVRPGDAPAKRTYPLVLTINVPGFDEAGSRIPIAVTGTSNDGEEVDVHAYVGFQSDGIELLAGTYEVSVEGSPIASDGTVYAVPKDTVSATVGEEDAQVPTIALEPIAADAVTDEQIQDAVSWAQRDQDCPGEADALDEAARKRRDEAVAQASEDALADAFNAVLDSSGASWYTLAEMSGDDVPELIVCFDPGSPERKTCVFYHFDEGSGVATQFAEKSLHPHRDCLCDNPDGHSITFVGQYGGYNSGTRLTFDNMENDGIDYDQASLNEQGIYVLPNYDLSDRGPIEALRG